MSGESKLPSDVSFTHLDEQLFDGAGATKRDLSTTSTPCTPASCPA